MPTCFIKLKSPFLNIHILALGGIEYIMIIICEDSNLEQWRMCILGNHKKIIYFKSFSVLYFCIHAVTLSDVVLKVWKESVLTSAILQNGDFETLLDQTYNI